MKLDIQKLVGNFKAWLALGAILLTCAGALVTWANMPKKVSALEEKIESHESKIAETRSGMDKMAGTIEKYVAVHAEQQKAQEQREQLMLKLIEEVSKK